MRLFGQKRSNRGPQKILCTFGEKEYASKRVSIIFNNAISNAKHTTRGQQGSSTAKRKCLHFEASVQCDRGTGAHEVRKGGETALFEPINCPIQQKQHIILMRFFVGGDNRARTCDPVLVRHVLSQLSYTPNLW